MHDPIVYSTFLIFAGAALLATVALFTRQSMLVSYILVGVLLAELFGLEGPSRQAGITQAGMPSAVITIILATEYDVEPEFVTSVVFATTLLCPITLTPLLGYLGA